MDMIKVGDTMLYTKHFAAKPEMVEVSKITPKGWIQIADRASYFKQCGDHYETTSRDGVKKREKLYPYTHVCYNDLLEEHNTYVKKQKDKEAARQAFFDERDKRLAQELADAKQSHNHKLPIVTTQEIRGAVVYVLKLEVHPNLIVRKGHVEMLFVKVKHLTDDKWADPNDKVEGNPTWANGGSHSFPSSSAVYGETVEEVLWRCVADCYSGSN